MPHTGGKRFKDGRRVLPDAPPLARSRRPARPADRRHAGRASSSSRTTAVLDGKGATQQIVVRAKYSDGTDRDVTSLALFLTNNDNSADDRRQTALVTAGERGEAFVMARFDTFTVGSQVIVLPKGLKFAWPERRPRTTTSTRSSTPSSRSCASPRRSSAPTRPSSAASTSTSSACCRRPRSTTGSWPTRRRTSASKLVDELLDRKEFAELWVLKWAELLQIRSSQPGQLQGDAALLQLAAGQDRQATCRSTRWCRSCSAPTAARSRTRPTNYYQIETRHAEGDRERRPGVHGHADPVRPVPQPPVRPLDDGRLLRLRRVLHARSAARQAEDPRETDRLQLRRRRGDPPGHAAGR